MGTRQRSAKHGGPWGLLAVALACLSGCQKTPVCSFESIASADGTTRLALLIDAHAARRDAPRLETGGTSELAPVARALSDLDFPAGNVCSLEGSRATLSAARQAIDEFMKAEEHVARFLYFSGRGSDVVDASADEPDERDETLVFADADGRGSGELLDDELADWLESIAERSDSSLVVINAGVSRADGSARPPDTDWTAAPTRKIKSRGKGSDGAAQFLGAQPPEHVAIARGLGGSSSAFDMQVVGALTQAAKNTPSVSAFADRMGVELRLAGFDPEISGSGQSALFGITFRDVASVSGGDAPLTLTLRAPGLPGEIPATLRADVEAQLASLSGTVTLAGAAGDFELSRASDGSYVLRGPDGRARNRFAELGELPKRLSQHQVQRRLLAMRGNGAPQLQDFRSLRLSLRAARSQSPCADGIWDQVVPGAVQSIPLCHRWFIHIDLADNTPPLYIETLVLSSDGSSFLLPHEEPLRIDGGHDYDAADQIFVGAPPVDVYDQVFVVGSTEPVDARALLDGRVRAPEGARATFGALSFKVIANSAFADSGELSGREYTIKQFDIRPYLPDDDDSRLARFLRTADALAKASATDGYSYKQHEWRQATDAANLALGIDCSRSIWYAFTRGGLAYNQGDGYLTTAEMVAASSRMKDQFDQCPIDGSYVIGDVLVYRSDTRGDGHVVTVIDPEKRIAWGSHGWDGNPGQGLASEMDTGVEYQKIKVKTDWMKWDRPDMQLNVCWRYREFAAERASGRSSQGSRMLEERCSC